jgi:hypothetical protein
MERLMRRKRDVFTRLSKNKEPLKRILIVCEGEQTEPNYFRDFGLSSTEVMVVGAGRNTLSLVEKTKQIKDEREDKIAAPFSSIWCVFDRDDNPAHNVDNSIQKAKKYNFNVAYSNEAFEIWFILHFSYISTALSRSQYRDILNDYLNVKYEKNIKGIYERILDKQQAAIRNAKMLAATYLQSQAFATRNPYTDVYALVEELNELRKIRAELLA